MKIIVYKDHKKEWRLKLVASNGRILLVSSEGYKREASVVKLIKHLADYDVFFV